MFGSYKPLALIFIGLLFFTSTAIPQQQSDKWVVKTRFSDVIVDTKCFAISRSPSHVAVGFRLDGTPFISFSPTEGPDLAGKLEEQQLGGPSVWIKGNRSIVGPLEFNWDASNGDIYYNGNEAQIAFQILASSKSVNFVIKMPNSIRQNVFASSVNGAAKAIVDIIRCNPKSPLKISDELDLAVYMFRKLSNYPTANIQTVLNRISEKVSFGKLIQGGVINSLYDCAPADRVSCYEALNNPTSDSALETKAEWGEWHDAFSSEPDSFRKFVKHHIDEANRNEFSLFSVDEKAKYQKLKAYETAAAQCKIGETEEGKGLNESEIFHNCAIRNGYGIWLQKNLCFDSSEREWLDCPASAKKKSN